MLVQRRTKDKESKIRIRNKREGKDNEQKGEKGIIYLKIFKQDNTISGKAVLHYGSVWSKKRTKDKESKIRIRNKKIGNKKRRKG